MVDILLPSTAPRMPPAARTAIAQVAELKRKSIGILHV